MSDAPRDFRDREGSALVRVRQVEPRVEVRHSYRRDRPEPDIVLHRSVWGDLLRRLGLAFATGAQGAVFDHRARVEQVLRRAIQHLRVRGDVNVLWVRLHCDDQPLDRI